MPDASAAVSSFLARLDEATREGARAWPGLGEALDRIAVAAREVWPQIAIGDEVFFAHIAGRLRDGSLPEALASTRGADLYLACACAEGDAAAIRAFDAHCLGDLGSVWSRFKYVVASPEDVRQLLHERLFLQGAGGRARILDYAGDGDLRNWTRVVVLRSLINLASRQSREEPTEDDMLFALSGDADAAEVGYLKAKYGAEVKLGFLEALERLTFRERNMLRYAFVDELSIDQIGEIYGVHRATAARWIARAREQFATHLRDDLVARLKISESEFASIMRLNMSGIELSLARLLRVGKR